MLIIVGSEEAILRHIKDNDPDLENTYGYGGRVVRVQGYDVIYDNRWFEAEIMEMRDYQQRASVYTAIDAMAEKFAPNKAIPNDSLPFDELSPPFMTSDDIEKLKSQYSATVPPYFPYFVNSS